jgi:hypothetical protein
VRTGANAKKVESQDGEQRVSDIKPKTETVEDTEREEAKKNETSEITRVRTAPAKLGSPKETADEWGQLLQLPLTHQFKSTRR